LKGIRHPIKAAFLFFLIITRWVSSNAQLVDVLPVRATDEAVSPQLRSMNDYFEG
jgi:hypothetical protein